eukprot:scaffold2142_cov190-Cylindrotheca_fusiformis.AAC.3
MNRHSFLSSQPFLFGLPSSSWPPPLQPAEDSGTTTTSRREILLRDHFLSIEVSSGPAFFHKPNREGVDPAMCPFEFAFHMANKKSDHRTTPSRTPTTSMSMMGGGGDMERNELLGFFYIDGKIYQVDFGMLKDVDVKMERDDAKPPSLVLQFPTCNFRIFCINGIPADQFSVLNAAKNRMLTLLADYTASPFPLTADAMMMMVSPQGSSAAGQQHSSSEPGQKEPEISHVTNEHQQMEEDANGQEMPEMGEAAVAEEDSVAMTRKCLESYNQSRQDVHTLANLLERPPPSDDNQNEELRNKVTGLMNSMAENVGSSFCARDQLCEAARIHDEQIHSCRTKVEDLLKSVWPITRPKKRARHSNQPTTSTTITVPPPFEETMTDIQSILDQHRTLLQSKYSLAYLPTRD